MVKLSKLGLSIGLLFSLVQISHPQNVIINELLADPSTDAILGDANGDGVRDAYQDEFVELVNVGPDTVDMTGWRVGDDEAGGDFQFPDGYKIAPDQIVVIFGGGDVSNVPGYDVDALKTRAFSGDGRIGNGLTNTGEFVVLLSDDGSADTYLAYGGDSGTGPPTSAVLIGITWEYENNTDANANNDNSITRSPDGNTSIADPFVQHLTVSQNLYSPAQTITGANSLNGILGDVNDDEIVNSSDALIVLSCDVGFDTHQFCPIDCGDVDNGGTVNSSDALVILSYDVQMEVPFPVGDVGCPQSVTPCLGCGQ